MASFKGPGVRLVAVVVGTEGSGKTTLLKRVRETARMRAGGLQGLGWSEADKGDSGGDDEDKSSEVDLDRPHQVTTTYRCKHQEKETEAEATVLFHEIGGAGLAHKAEAKRCTHVARAVLVVFDITSLSSYITAQELTKIFREDGENDCVITLIGNKNYSQQVTRAVATYSAQTFAEENQALYFEVNALGGQNVMESVSETLRLSVEPLFFQRLSSHQINRLNLVATTSLKQ